MRVGEKWGGRVGGEKLQSDRREPTGVLDVFIILIVTALTHPTGQGDHYLEFSGHFSVISMSNRKN